MRVVSVGEILWDLIGGKEFLGGAPFNLCAHLARLGHDAIFISAVGEDERGQRALSQARKLSIDVRFIRRTGAAKTGVSEVVLDEAGKATHHIPRPAAYDFVTLSDEERAELKIPAPELDLLWNAGADGDRSPNAYPAAVLRESGGKTLLRHQSAAALLDS